jgi:hypothetical protein
LLQLLVRRLQLPQRRLLQRLWRLLLLLQLLLLLLLSPTPRRGLIHEGYAGLQAGIRRFCNGISAGLVPAAPLPLRLCGRLLVWALCILT